MNATLYIKPNIIGLQFSEPKDRDLFWTLLGENRNCAEMFGKASIRLNPSRAKKLFQVPLYTDKIQVIEEQPPQAPAKLASAPVPMTALKAPEPIAAIGSLPPEVVGLTATVEPTPSQVLQSALAALPAPTPVPIPQVASVVDPMPADKRTKEYREWKARQK